MTIQADRRGLPGRRWRKLAAAEEQLWLLEREKPDDPAYLVPFAVWVNGPLEVAAVARALREVVARHEILRTVVRSAHGVPIAEVLAEAAVSCPVTRVASDAQALAGARALAGQIFAEGEFRVRATVFRVDAGRCLLLLVLHHAVCDASSLWVLLDELAAFYSADVAGRRPEVLPSAAQFAEVSTAELSGEAAGELDQAARSLADMVRSAPDVVNLPYDRADDAAELIEGRVLQLPVPAELNDATERTARRLAVSPNAVLLAAYGVLLDALAGARDALISVPVSHRRSAAEQRVIGFMVHSVPVRLRTGECDTAEELIRHAWASLRHGWTHAAASFGRVVADVNPQRVPGMNPLCQCEFSVQTVPDRLPAFGPATLEYQFVHNGGYKFNLSLEVVRSAAGRAIAVEYPAASFRPGTVRRLAHLYLRVLAGLTADGKARLADLDLVSRAERDWMAGHSTPDPRPAPERIPRLAERIELAIRRRPADAAVTAAGSSLSYGELGVLTVELAAALRVAGVTEGDRVAVLGDRGTAAVVAVVAAIRSGMSFVAIADDTPADRVAHVLAAARPAAVVVTARRLLALVPDRWRTGAVRYADGWLLTPGDGDQDPGRRPGEAYVVFTSGSTGEARGVSVPVVAISAITGAWDAAFGLTERPGRHLQLAPFSFDVFVGDVARTLGFGGTLVLAARDEVVDPRRLAGLIRLERIDTAEFVPIVARLLVEYLEHAGGGLPTMRRVMVGSDTWPVADALRLRALLPDAARLYCTYGTSESAVDATLFGVEPGHPLDGTVVPIGRPFPGVLVSVRDRAGRPLPPLWPGELWIGGDTVASGYLTPDDPPGGRFRVASGPDGPPVRWYRTGDRVRWDQQGQLHLLGRIDSEIKIRGVRVHPAEIEAVLCRYPSVMAAAVVAVGEGLNRALTAFVTGPVEADLGGVAAHARRHLLPVAVPAAFRVLDQIPTTRHGKVDHEALEALAATADAPAEEHAEPADELERTVADVCAEALGLPDVGVLDDFYTLGASSVHIARFAWRVSQAVGRQVSVRDVVAAPSVRALVQLISDQPAAGSGGRGMPDAAPPVPASRPVADGRLAAAPPAALVRAPVPPRRAVLTGATGNLGPGILRALLAAAAVVDELICLVRADGPAHARARVRAALSDYGADPELADDPRLRYCVADLSMPDAGLSASGVELVTGADVLVNGAAWVNFLYPYELLAPVNVQGVATLARLSGQERIKPLHHVSTRSAVAVGGRQPSGGYNESKAAAERLLLSCRDLGLPVSVYRPGFVLGRLAERPASPGLLESFLRECVRMGACPALPGHLNVVSADHVGTQIAANVLAPAPHDYLDLAGSEPLAWPAAWEVLRDYGVKLEELAIGEWLGRVGDGRTGEGWLEPFLPLCTAVGLPSLLSDDEPGTETRPGAQPVAEAWQQACARLAELAELQ